MTPTVLVVADDLTGGNSAAAGFSRAGVRAVNLVTPGPVPPRVSSVDVLVVTSETRHCSADTAAELTARVPGLAEARLTGVRIDSTLRGNISRVVETVLELRRRDDRRTVALCVAAHPAAGRQTRNGTQLLDGVPLEHTALSDDSLNPVSSSDVVEAVTRGTRLTAGVLPIAVVAGPLDALIDELRGLALRCDVVVSDALSVSDLMKVSRAAGALAGHVDWVPVDPGPFAVLLAQAVGAIDTGDAQRILVVSGSPSVLTRAQMRELDAAQDADVVVLASALADEDIVDVDAAGGARIVRDLARDVRQAMETGGFAGLYCTGGDLAAEVVRSLDALGIEAIEEIVPLAVLGTLVGGRWDGYPIVTKGGQVGDSGTTVECIARIRHHLHDRRGSNAADGPRPETPIGREGT